MFNEYLLNRKQGGAVSFQNFSMNIKEPFNTTIKGKFDNVNSVDDLLKELKKISKLYKIEEMDIEKRKEAYSQAMEKAKELITTQTQTEMTQEEQIEPQIQSKNIVKMKMTPELKKAMIEADKKAKELITQTETEPKKQQDLKGIFKLTEAQQKQAKRELKKLLGNVPSVQNKTNELLRNLRKERDTKNKQNQEQERQAFLKTLQAKQQQQQSKETPEEKLLKAIQSVATKTPAKRQPTEEKIVDLINDVIFNYSALNSSLRFDSVDKDEIKLDYDDYKKALKKLVDIVEPYKMLEVAKKNQLTAFTPEIFDGSSVYKLLQQKAK